MSYKKLQGNKYGRLTVMAYHGKNKHKIATWFCECECGGIIIIPSGSLVCGYTKSCGCIEKEKPSHTIHNGAGTRLHHIWKSMKQRCENPNCASYKSYGLTGITLCPQWKNFAIFQKWSIENGYNSSLTIDRINNKGNYEPDNCRWATFKQQSRNKSNTVYYEINGINKPLVEWAEILNKSYKRSIQRYKRGIKPFDY
jgi:hypothetical protein